MEQLLGLLYYNYAIDTHNHKDLLPPSIILTAPPNYQSRKIEEFSKIVLFTVEEAKINHAEKEICLKKIISLRQKMPLLATKTVED
jgi:hypothetical protein